MYAENASEVAFVASCAHWKIVFGGGCSCAVEVVWTVLWFGLPKSSEFEDEGSVVWGYLIKS